VDRYQESAGSHNFNYACKLFKKFRNFSGVEESIYIRQFLYRRHAVVLNKLQDKWVVLAAVKKLFIFVL